jgi:4-amino-4-deoxy-L-arabinose transferase-like glycosyltransferase
MINNEKVDLAILLLISLLLSVYLFFKTYVISMDGAFQYIPMAKIFVLGLLKDAIGYSGQQPLYPFLIAFVSRWVCDFEVAGKLVSSFFGVLIILPVYFLGKRMFDEKIAFYSAFFLAIHPYIRRFSADVLKESTYLFCLAAAIWFAWRTIQGEKKYPYLFIPLFSAIAYLTRSDGVEVLLVVFFYILFIKKFSVSKTKWTIIILLILSCAIVFLPYLIHLKGNTGTWTLSKTKSIAELLGLGVGRGGASFIHKIIFSLKKLNLEILAIFHPLYVLLLVVGLFKTVFSHFKDGDKFLIILFILHYVVSYLLILNLSLFSGRHVLPLLIFSIYWVAEGFLITYNWVSKKLESWHLLLRLELNKRSKFVLITFLILALAVVLPKTLKPQRYERLPEKWAGIWIKSHYGKGMAIFTTVHRVAYYADSNLEYIDLKKNTIDEIKTSMIEKRALYLVIRGRETLNFPNEAIKKDFVELNRFEGRRMETIIVYKRFVR